MGSGKELQTRNKLFISYHEKESDSMNIAKQLENFFGLGGWGLDCQLVKYSEKTQPPRDIIRRNLAESLYLIQLFSTQPATSNWMRTEWDMYEALHKDKEDYKEPIIFYTKRTDRNHSSFNSIKVREESGYLKVVQIDDPEAAHDILIAILKEINIINDPERKRKGKIELPEFCRARVIQELIEVSEVGKFIENFYEANRRGLECVYPDRKAAMEWVRAKFNALHGEEMIRMAGFTLKRYVHPEYKDRNGEEGVGSEFVSAINRGVKAELLLLNPDCQAARRRAVIESPGKSFENTLFFEDYDAVRKYYKEHDFQGRVQVELYEEPYVGLVIFENEIYIELYHTGDELADPNICGHVPILVARNGSIYYREFMSHFTNHWPKK